MGTPALLSKSELIVSQIMLYFYDHTCLPSTVFPGDSKGGCGNSLQPRPLWDPNEHKRGMKNTFQGAVYNFLERPTGWKCFLYHFSV